MRNLTIRCQLPVPCLDVNTIGLTALTTLLNMAGTCLMVEIGMKELDIEARVLVADDKGII